MSVIIKGKRGFLTVLIREAFQEMCKSGNRNGSVLEAIPDGVGSLMGL